MKIDDELLNKVASVAFALACCFSAIQSGSIWPAIIAALCSAIVLNAKRLHISKNPMRVNAYAMWLVGIVILLTSGFTASSLVAALSTFIFGSGNFLSARNNDNEILNNPSIRGISKVINHPATWYSFGYICTALLASRITNGKSNSFAIASMAFDIAMTLLSFFGLMLNRFSNPAASFMALVSSSVFGIIASVASGNLWGLINKLCSGTGEFALAYKINQAYELQHCTGIPIHQASKQTRMTTFFNTVSKILIFPLLKLQNNLSHK